MPCEDEGNMGHCECYYAEGQCCWCEEFFGSFMSDHYECPHTVR